MAVNKICGIETEYGILHTGYKKAGKQLNPIVASSVLINAYVSEVMNQSPNWNYEDENPIADARGFIASGQMIPEIEAQLMNAILTNGARYYVDHAHPEFSSPECSNAMSALLYDRAGEEILKKSMELVKNELGDGEEIVIYKNNSDGKGNSYGCHENYLLSRLTPFSDIVQGATSHFITRQLYTGAGKMGSELNTQDKEITFQLSQRADFIEVEVGLETTLKRPIINTRDEPHSYPQHYRRFHVIAGDANISQTATFLKLGTTAIVMSMIEDKFWGSEFIFAEPVKAYRQVSTDLSINEPLELEDGNSITALEVQWEIFRHAKKYGEAEGLESVNEEVGQKVLELWEEILNGLETDPMSLSNQLDWVAKKKLIEAYKDRHNLDYGDSRLFSLDLQYHDLRSTHSIAERLVLAELVDHQDVLNAINQPPPDTRAYFRGMCLQKFAKDIVSISWDSVIFKLEDNSLKRIVMMEPSKGTKAFTEKLFKESDTFQELIQKIEN